MSGIRPELLASSDGQPRGRKKKLNESELWEVNQLKKSGVLTVEEQPDFDDEHGFVRHAALPPCHATCTVNNSLWSNAHLSTLQL